MITFDCTLRRPDFTLDAAFSAPQGLVALFGPSGSGKSTIIRLIAGLERPDRGRISLEGVPLADTARGHWLPPHKRRTGLVFQDGQLLPHLTVSQNLMYGRSFTPPHLRRIEFGDTVALLGLKDLLERRPATLSGGERQRAAIGRALLASPRILLLDEPLASLDQARKLEILPYIETLRDTLAMPIVYVSHAIEEVARLATTVVRLDGGKVAATGAPGEVLSSLPALQGGERFDLVSMITGKVDRLRPEFGVTVLTHPAGDIVLPGLVDKPRETPVRIMIRATNVTLATVQPEGLSIRTALKGRIASISSGSGAVSHVTIALEGGDQIAAAVTRLALCELGIAPGRDIIALVKAVSIDERGVPGLRAV